MDMKEHDVVRLARTIRRGSVIIPLGTTGTIVSCYVEKGSPVGYRLELSDHQSFSLLDVEAGDIQLLAPGIAEYEDLTEFQKTIVTAAHEEGTPIPDGLTGEALRKWTAQRIAETREEAGQNAATSQAITPKFKTLQACFLAWLVANGPRFVVPPVVSNHTDVLIEFMLYGETVTITAHLMWQRLTASIGARTIIELDLPTGVVEESCGLISPAVVVLHETVEAAWSVQFDRFLLAINRHLVSDRT